MSYLPADIAWVGLLSILAVALVAQAAETPRELSLGQNAATAGDPRPPAVLPQQPFSTLPVTGVEMDIKAD
jgi:hypothetical protein